MFNLKFIGIDFWTNSNTGPITGDKAPFKCIRYIESIQISVTSKNYSPSSFQLNDKLDLNKKGAVSL